MFENRLCSLLHACTILLALVAVGCGSNASKQPTDKALQVVEQFLDAWSRGEPPDKFADPSHSIQGSDPDWKAGYRLMSFLTAEAKSHPEKPDVIRCRVALSIQDKKSRKLDKEVVYEVEMGKNSIVRRVAP